MYFILYYFIYILKNSKNIYQYTYVPLGKYFILLVTFHNSSRFTLVFFFHFSTHLSSHFLLDILVNLLHFWIFYYMYSVLKSVFSFPALLRIYILNHVTIIILIVIFISITTLPSFFTFISILFIISTRTYIF